MSKMRRIELAGWLVIAVMGMVCMAWLAGCDLRVKPADGVPIATGKVAAGPFDTDINAMLELLATATLRADIEAKGIDKSQQTQQHVATSQPVSAGRDARTYNPVITINGSESILLVVIIAGGGLLAWRSWSTKGKAIKVMMKAIEGSNADLVKKRIAKDAYESGVSQVIYDQKKRYLKNPQKPVTDVVKVG